jgi:O-acetylserine/cysteine efflux transporter
VNSSQSKQGVGQSYYQLPVSHLLFGIGDCCGVGHKLCCDQSLLGEFSAICIRCAALHLCVLASSILFPRPKISWINLCVYGVAVGVGQFGILYFAIDGNISPGLASLVIQTQVFFTIGFAMLFAKERLKLYQTIAVAVAITGLGIIAAHTDATTTTLGLALVVFCGFSWGIANTASRQAGSTNMLAYVVWASLYAIPPLVFMAVIFEGGWSVIGQSLINAPIGAWLGVLWQSWGKHFVWLWCLGMAFVKTSCSGCGPSPFIGTHLWDGASAYFLGEPLPPWKIEAAGLVITGLMVNLFWPNIRNRLAK